ncbi:hypothetical protein D3C71_1503320 [compost metagenome]
MLRRKIIASLYWKRCKPQMYRAKSFWRHLVATLPQLWHLQRSGQRRKPFCCFALRITIFLTQGLFGKWFGVGMVQHKLVPSSLSVCDLVFQAPPTDTLSKAKATLMGVMP